MERGIRWKSDGKYDESEIEFSGILVVTSGSYVGRGGMDILNQNAAKICNRKVHHMPDLRDDYHDCK